MTNPEIPLTGGQMTDVVRIGTTVHRSTGPWTPAVHALLHYLETTGFAWTPRVLAVDQDRREILTYLEGEAGFFSPNRVVPADLWSGRLLIEGATMLRNFHDATVGFTLPGGVSWHSAWSTPTAGEVSCHNDFAPYNSIFRDGHLVGIIDFDEASPGSRAWDLAYAAYTFIPLYPDDRCGAVGLNEPFDRGRRLRSFCDAYGLVERTGFVEIIEERVRAVGSMIRSRAAAGDERFQRKVEEGHTDEYDSNAVWLQQVRKQLQTSLT